MNGIETPPKKKRSKDRMQREREREGTDIKDKNRTTKRTSEELDLYESIDKSVQDRSKGPSAC
jgi:hypothetical protein